MLAVRLADEYVLQQPDAQSLLKLHAQAHALLRQYVLNDPQLLFRHW